MNFPNSFIWKNLQILNILFSYNGSLYDERPQLLSLTRKVFENKYTSVVNKCYHDIQKYFGPLVNAAINLRVP